MKIILIVDSEFPPNTGLTIRMFELGKALINRGHSVYLISRGKRPGISDHQGIKVLQVKVNVTKGKSELYSRIKYAYKAMKAVKRHGLQDSDFVIGWNFFPNLAGYLISRKYNIRHVCDMTDFYFDVLKADKPSLFFSPAVSVLKNMECRFIPRKSFKVVAVSDFMYNVMNKRFLIPKKKMEIINDGMYPGIKPTLHKNTLKRGLGLGNEKIIFFLGNMGRHDGVDLLFDAFKNIRKKMKAKLVFVGGGRKYYKNFRKRVESSRLGKDVIFTGYLPRQQALNYMSIADVGVISLRKRLATDITFTFKFFEYAALGVPVVCTDIATLSDLITDKNAGVVVRSGQAESLERGILQVLKGEKEFSLKPGDFREFWWDNIMKGYATFLENHS
jgi:glycosyltransferase involved in cell wall biosynthesis